MNKNKINTLVNAIAHDNKEYIDGTIADYILNNSELSGDWSPLLEDPTDKEIEELKDYLLEYWDIAPDEVIF